MARTVGRHVHLQPTGCSTTASRASTRTRTSTRTSISSNKATHLLVRACDEVERSLSHQRTCGGRGPDQKCTLPTPSAEYILWQMQLPELAESHACALLSPSVPVTARTHGSRQAQAAASATVYIQPFSAMVAPSVPSSMFVRRCMQGV